MIFNSIEFLLFGLLFFLLWPLVCKKDNTRWGFIVIASFFFYGWWDWRFLFLILFSGLIDFFAGLALQKYSKWKRPILGLSLLGNLGSLFVFKYSEFFARFIEDIGAFAGKEWNVVETIPEFALILPVGISFYTFQSLSYTIDIYRGRLQPTANILLFFSYLAMFPQLVAGPIVRAKDLLSQLSRYRPPNFMEKWNGTKLIVFGLFQKVVIADNLSYFIDSAYEGKSIYAGSFYWWVVAVAFSFQIYADFSGYSSIARGLAKLMGYHFKMNFNHPYLSRTLREFWTKWHISLSTWFRDYVYIPLGGSRAGVWIGFLTLTLTMMVSGVWHGANYTFLVWAGLHSFFLIMERIAMKYLNIKRVSSWMIPVIFLQATLAWVYFRAASIEEANRIIGYLFEFSSSNTKFLSDYFDNLAFLMIALAIEIVFFFYRTKRNWFRRYLKVQDNWDAVFLACSITMIVFFRGEGAQFIYFQF